MNPMDLLTGVLTFLAQVPYVGPVIAIIVKFALPLVAVVTAIVAVWHAVVLALQALAMVPGLQGLANLANSLKTSEDKVDGFVNTYILPALNRLSVLPLPTAAPAAPVAPSA